MASDKITPNDFIKAKRNNERIVMVTAYEYSHARLADEAGIDGILVGDSLGMVIMGFRSTLPVTMNMVLHHLKAVLNARPKSLVVADMPFMSYEPSREEAVRNAGKLMKKGADAVKLEGGLEIVDRVEALTKAGIPVMGHVGLNPQRAALKGLKMRGKDLDDALDIIESSKALEEAGAFSIVIEYTASEVASIITRRLKIPTICIGSGPECDGQILVFHDLVGLNPSPPPFARKYVDGYSLFLNAMKNYVSDVKRGVFPSEGMFWGMKDGEYEKLKKYLEEKHSAGRATHSL